MTALRIETPSKIVCGLCSGGAVAVRLCTGDKKGPGRRYLGMAGGALRLAAGGLAVLAGDSFACYTDINVSRFTM